MQESEETAKNLNQRIMLQLDSDQSPIASQDEAKLVMYKSQQHAESTDSFNQRGANNLTSKPVSQVRSIKAQSTSNTTALASKNQSQAKRQSEHSVTAAQKRNGASAVLFNQSQAQKNAPSHNLSTTNQCNQNPSSLNKTKSQPRLVPSQGQVPSRDNTHRLTNGPEFAQKLQPSGTMTATQNSRPQTASTFSSTIKICPTSTKNQVRDEKLAQNYAKKTPTATLMTSKSSLQNVTAANKQSNFSSTLSSVANLVPASRNEASTSYGNAIINSHPVSDLHRPPIDSSHTTSMKKTSEGLQSQKSQIIKKAQNQSTTKLQSQTHATSLQIQKQQLALLSQSNSKEQLVDAECQNVATMLNFDISKENQLQEPRMTLTSHAQNHRHQLSLVPSSTSFPQNASNIISQVPSSSSSQQNLQGLHGLSQSNRFHSGVAQQNCTAISRTAKKSMDFSTRYSGSQAYNAHRKQAIIQESNKSGTSRARQTRQNKSSFKTYHEHGESRQILSTENSMTRVCVFDTQLATQTSLRETSLVVESKACKTVKSRIPNENDEEQSVLSCGRSASKLDLSHQQSVQVISTAKTAKKFAERKKSSMLRNTTLEEIYENKPDRDFVLSPSSQLAAAQAYGIHTVKNSSSGGMQSFSLATINSVSNIYDQNSGQNGQSHYNNYIQKNISYVNKLNQQLQQKDRKSSEIISGGLHNNSKSSSNLLSNHSTGNKSILAEKQKLNQQLTLASAVTATLHHPYNSIADYNPEFTKSSKCQPTILSELDSSLDNLLAKSGEDQLSSTFTTRQPKLNVSHAMFSQAITSHNSINQSRTPAAGAISQSVTPSTMQLNQRRASEKHGDYSRPTLSSISRAKSVAPGQKRPAQAQMNQSRVQPTLVDLENENSIQGTSSFEAAAMKSMLKSPNRVGPIQIYEKSKSNLKKSSMQTQIQSSNNLNETFQSKLKPNSSGVKLAQQAYTNYRQQQNSSSMQVRGTNEEKSTERLRLTNHKDEILNSMTGAGLSRQSINKRQSFQTSTNVQSRLGNKSQRNSISLSFSMNMQNTQTHFQEDQSYMSGQGKNKLVSLSSQVTHKAKILQNQRQKPSSAASAHLVQKKQQAGLMRKVSQSSQLNMSAAAVCQTKNDATIKQKNSSSTLSTSSNVIVPHLHIQATQQSSCSRGNMLSARSISGSAIPEEEEQEEGGILHTFPSPDRNLSKEQDSEIEEEQPYQDDCCEEVADEDEQQVTQRYNYEDDEDIIADESKQESETKVNLRSQYFEGDSQEIAEASAIAPTKSTNVFKKTTTTKAVFQVSFDLKN